MDNNYWKEKYADYHSRSESRIAELEKEKEELRNAYNTILEQCKKEQAENTTYKANADAVQKYITQNEQLKTHIDGLEKKNAKLKAENDRLKQIPEQYNAYIRGREQQLDAANAKIEKLIHETVILKKVASSAQNAAIHINQQAEKYEERIKVLEKDLVDWQDAYKELEKAHDKIQGAYQDDHCDLLKYKENFLKIKEIVHERVNGENIKGWDYFTGITEIWHLLLELQEEEDETKNT